MSNEELLAEYRNKLRNVALNLEYGINPIEAMLYLEVVRAIVGDAAQYQKENEQNGD